jgi:hypothetical protein
VLCEEVLAFSALAPLPFWSRKFPFIVRKIFKWEALPDFPSLGLVFSSGNFSYTYSNILLYSVSWLSSLDREHIASLKHVLHISCIANTVPGTDESFINTCQVYISHAEQADRTQKQFSCED